MFKHNGCSIVERVSAWCGWFNPGNINGKRTKKRARYAHGVDSRSQVVTEVWQRDLGGGTCTSYVTIAFKHRGRNTGGSQNDRG
jgi:hypothetical protein